jgi:hypothetical protein
MDSEEVYNSCTEIEGWQIARHSDGAPDTVKYLQIPVWLDFYWMARDYELGTGGTELFLILWRNQTTSQYIETTNLSKHTILTKQMDECITPGPRHTSWSESGTRGSDIQLRFEEVGRDSECGLADSEFVQANVLRVLSNVQKINSFD